jgi:sirohydrochlorin cobaltochelatase
MNSPAIVLAAFGTSVPEAQEVFAGLMQAVRERFPACPVRLAFTSPRIRRKWAERGQPVPSPVEALTAFRDQGHRTAVVQSLLVVPGEEHTKLAETQVEGLDVVCGPPLLAAEEDYQAVVEVIGDARRPGRPNVLVCHGNDQHPAHNGPNLALARRLAERFDDVWVASVEGEPGLAPLAAVRTVAQRCGAVHFIPLMLVAGEHVRRDVLGDEPDSWRHQVGAVETSCAPPLGAEPRIIERYLSHLARARGRAVGMSR